MVVPAAAGKKLVKKETPNAAPCLRKKCGESEGGLVVYEILGVYVYATQLHEAFGRIQMGLALSGA